MPEQHQDTSELNEAKEVFDMKLPSSNQAAEVLHPGKQPFHFPAPL